MAGGDAAAIGGASSAVLAQKQPPEALRVEGGATRVYLVPGVTARTRAKRTCCSYLLLYLSDRVTRSTSSSNSSLYSAPALVTPHLRKQVERGKIQHPQRSRGSTFLFCSSSAQVVGGWTGTSTASNTAALVIVRISETLLPSSLQRQARRA